MEKNVKGEAVLKGIHDHKTVRDEISKQIGHWFEGHESEWNVLRTKYKVHMEKKRDGHEVFCQTEFVNIETRNVWISVDSGSTPYEALSRCLSNVKKHGLGFTMSNTFDDSA